MCFCVTVIESNENCERGKVEAKVLETLLKLVAAKSPRVGAFVKELMSAYRDCFKFNRCRKSSTMRVRILSNFHTARLSKLPQVWKKVFLKLGESPDHDPLYPQSVNRRVMNRLLVKHFSSHTKQSCAAESECSVALKAEDENVLRYVSGYVSLKLMRRFEKQSGCKAQQFVECLSKMAIMGTESSFYEYTKEWMKIVNRGGLFQVNETTYLFYRALEIKTRVCLPQHLRKSQGVKEDLISSIKDDPVLQTHWSPLTGDIYDDDDAQELLDRIVKLWVTIRGYSSLTASWLEDYKKATKKSTKKSKRLRKSVKEHTTNEKE